MLENRDLRQDLIAIGLFGVVLFLGIALVTYDPADPVGEPIAPLNWLHQPNPVVFPQHAIPTNACGHWGAWTSDLAFSTLGYPAYFLLFSLAAIDWTLLRRRPLHSPWLRSTGFLLAITGLTTLLGLIVPQWSPGPVVGAGGYLGTLGSGLLEMHFATLGASVLALSVTVCGLLLFTDYELLHLAKRLAVLAPAGLKLPHLRLPTRNHQETELAEDDLDEEELEIRISGKRRAIEEVEEEEDESESELEHEDESWNEGDAEDEAELEEDEQDEAPEALVIKTPTDKQRERQEAPSAPHFKVKNKKKQASDARAEVMTQLDEAAKADDLDDYQLPDIDLLLQGDDVSYEAQEQEVRRKARQIEKTFAEFGFQVKVVEIETGPVIAQYEIQLEAGLRLSKITGLADDLAIGLRVPSVRIVAPIPGKNTVGIEVPNETRQVVRLREVMEESDGKTSKMKIPIFLGKDVSGNPLVVDLATMPHLLIAGRTGTGKSVCLNAIITSMLMTRRPDEVRMLMIDPKMVELSGYGRLPHLMHPVVTDMRKAEAILAWAVEKMEERYSLLAKAGVRHIVSYNQLGEEELMDRLQPETEEERAGIPLNLPFIVIVADEIADMMMTAGKEVEQHIIRLAQKSRAVGIHLILATQKPTVDVITGLIKSNLPARIAFQVASRTDSRVVLDEMGADKLLGNGDMLFLWPGTSSLLRGQGTYLGDDEIEMVTASVSKHGQNFVNELVNLKVEEAGDAPTNSENLRKRDDLYESAIDCVVREGRGSVSLLQRTLGIGYGRAARLIDFMAEDGIVGPYNGSQAREVVISIEQWQQIQEGGEIHTAPAAATEPAKPRRSNKIKVHEDEQSGTDMPANTPRPRFSDDAWEDRDTEQDVEDVDTQDTEDEELDHPSHRFQADLEPAELDSEEYEYELEDEDEEEEESEELEDELDEEEEYDEEDEDEEELEEDDDADDDADDEEEYEEEYEDDDEEEELDEEEYEEEEDEPEDEVEPRSDSIDGRLRPSRN